MQRPRRDGKAHGPGKKSDQRALDQQLLQQPAPAGSQGKTHADFPSARGRSRKQQARHIGARNQQEQRHGSHGGGHDGPCVRIDVPKLSLAGNPHAGVALNLWISGPQLPCQNIHFRSCIRQRNPSLQVSIHNPRADIPVLQALARTVAYEWPRRNRRPENGRRRKRAQVVRWRHADNGESHAIEVHRGTYHAWVRVKLALPEITAQNHYGLRSRLIIFRQEQPASRRLRSQQRKVIARYEEAHERVRASLEQLRQMKTKCAHYARYLFRAGRRKIRRRECHAAAKHR